MNAIPGDGREPSGPDHPGPEPHSGPPYPPPGDDGPSGEDRSGGSWGQQPPPAGWDGPPGGPGHVPEHPQATTALVLGVLGLAACLVLAPFAMVIGRRAVGEVDAAQGRLGGRGAAQAGYVMGVVGTVLLALAVAGVVVTLLLFGALGLGSLAYVG